MSFLIKVKHVTQLHVIENGVKKAKTLLPSNKYIIQDINNSQISDLKKSKSLIVKQASLKEESVFENLRLN